MRSRSPDVVGEAVVHVAHYDGGARPALLRRTLVQLFITTQWFKNRQPLHVLSCHPHYSVAGAPVCSDIQYFTLTVWHSAVSVHL